MVPNTLNVCLLKNTNNTVHCSKIEYQLETDLVITGFFLNYRTMYLRIPYNKIHNYDK